MFYFYVPRGRLEVQEQLDEQSRILDHSLKDYDKRLIPALKGTYIYIYIYILHKTEILSDCKFIHATIFPYIIQCHLDGCDFLTEKSRFNHPGACGYINIYFFLAVVDFFLFCCEISAAAN